MDIYNAKSVLSGKSCRSSHSIASMSPYHFLICFETPKSQCQLSLIEKSNGNGSDKTHAPPELSEPAMTSTRPFPILKAENKVESIQ